MKVVSYERNLAEEQARVRARLLIAENLIARVLGQLEQEISATLRGIDVVRSSKGGYKPIIRLGGAV